MSALPTEVTLPPRLQHNYPAIPPLSADGGFPTITPGVFSLLRGCRPDDAFGGSPRAPEAIRASPDFFIFMRRSHGSLFHFVPTAPFGAFSMGLRPYAPLRPSLTRIAKKKATCLVALFIRPTVVFPSEAHRGRTSLLAACATSFAPVR